MNPLHQISDPWKSVQPASVDNELICNVNYIKHPPRQHLCVSVFNLKRLSLKMSFSIKSLDSIYISCIRVNLCLTQSINHCQECCVCTSPLPPLPSPPPPILAHAMFKKAPLDTAYKRYSSWFSGQRLTSGEGTPAQRGVQCGRLAGRWRKGRKGSPSQLLLAALEGSPKERCPFSWWLLSNMCLLGHWRSLWLNGTRGWGLLPVHSNTAL